MALLERINNHGNTNKAITMITTKFACWFKIWIILQTQIIL